MGSEEVKTWNPGRTKCKLIVKEPAEYMDNGKKESPKETWTLGTQAGLLPQNTPCKPGKVSKEAL